jgi:hypothetical protein
LAYFISTTYQPVFQRELFKEYLHYLSILGLTKQETKNDMNERILKPQLRFLLSNVAAEKILLHVYHHGGGHLRGIARDHNIGIGATQRVLRSFVKEGLLKKEQQGRIVWYSFNENCPILNPLLELIRIVYDDIPEEMKKQLFNPKYTLLEDH